MSFEETSINPKEYESKGFESTSSFDELYDMLRAHGDVIGTQKTYSADEIIKIIEQVRHGHRDITFVTRSHGLKDTVQKLLQNDKIYRKYVKE